MCGLKVPENWVFNKDVAEEFEDHVRQSVPSYDYIQSSVIKLSRFFTPEGGTIIDLGCGIGETLSSIYLDNINKDLKLIGIDESNAMLEIAKRKNEGIESFTWLNKPIEHSQMPKDTDLVLSLLSLQFTEPNKREEVIMNCYDSLKKGGAFLIVEKVFSESGIIQDMFTQIYHDEKEELGLSPIEIRQKDKSLRSVMRPFTLKENEDMLTRAGFSKSEIFFRDFQFIGILAIK